jgi:prepilin-type N-terminal cleavage/methylation domain-containing protein
MAGFCYGEKFGSIRVMKRHAVLWSRRGFTLIEVVIVMAIVGLMLIEVLGGSQNGINNERFSGQMRQITDNIHQLQTDSFSTRTGTSCGGAPRCFWRGSVVNLAVNNNPEGTYSSSLLYGTDLSVTGTDQNPLDGIEGLNSPVGYSLNSLKLTKITVGSGSTGDPTTSQVAIAFLAPAGEAAACAGASCTPNPDGSVRIYSDTTDVVQLYFSDTTTSLAGIVTIKLADGTISWTT